MDTFNLYIPPSEVPENQREKYYPSSTSISAMIKTTWEWDPERESYYEWTTNRVLVKMNFNLYGKDLLKITYNITEEGKNTWNYFFSIKDFNEETVLAKHDYSDPESGSYIIPVYYGFIIELKGNYTYEYCTSPSPKIELCSDWETKTDYVYERTPFTTGKSVFLESFMSYCIIISIIALIVFMGVYPIIKYIIKKRK